MIKIIYVEYDSLTRLEITDPKNYLRKCLNNKSIIFLETCASGQNILGQVQAAIEDVVTTSSWVDIMVFIIICYHSNFKFILV